MHLRPALLACLLLAAFPVIAAEPVRAVDTWTSIATQANGTRSRTCRSRSRSSASARSPPTMAAPRRPHQRHQCLPQG
jgi:hypothetical protein